jgi:putative ABC transport system permease protein
VWPVMAMMKGVTSGLLTTVLFALPALLAVRGVRPSFLLRKDFASESGESGPGLDYASLVASGGTIAGLWAIAVWISASLLYATVFAGSLAIAILIIGGVGALLLRFLKSISRRSAIRNSPSLRHGIANLYRPGAHAVAILASIAIGVMFTLSVYSVQHSILDEIRSTAPPDTPNVFLINVTETDRQGLDELIESDPAITVTADFHRRDGAREFSANRKIPPISGLAGNSDRQPGFTCGHEDPQWKMVDECR